MPRFVDPNDPESPVLIKYKFPAGELEKYQRDFASIVVGQPWTPTIPNHACPLMARISQVIMFACHCLFQIIKVVWREMFNALDWMTIPIIACPFFFGFVLAQPTVMLKYHVSKYIYSCPNWICFTV